MLGGSNDETFQDPRFETNTAGGWPELLLLVVPFSWLHIVDIQMENEMVAVVIVVIASGIAKKTDWPFGGNPVGKNMLYWGLH